MSEDVSVAQTIADAVEIIADTTTSIITTVQSAQAADEARAIDARNFAYDVERDKVGDAQTARGYALKEKELKMNELDKYMNRMTEKKKMRRQDIDKAANMLINRAGVDSSFKNTVWKLWGGQK